MKKNSILFFLFLVIFLAAAILLISGSSVLLYSINEVPAGTPITWLGLFSLAAMIYLGIQNLQNPTSNIYQVLNWILRANILLAVLWVPICYFLAGNVSFNFSEKATFQGGQLAMRIFWIYTFSLIVLPILILFFHLIIRIFQSFRNNKKVGN